jgi:CheY-like chemotaxis protein
MKRARATAEARRSEAALQGDVAAKLPAPEDVPLGHGQTILVVEDHPGLRRVVMRQLIGLGYRALEAANADAALVTLEQQPTDLLFTDIMMPGRLNGLDLARVALSRWPKMRVVLTSGSLANINASIDLSTRRLIKPYLKADLARALRDALQTEPKALD